jgi:hypothetical protein
VPQIESIQLVHRLPPPLVLSSTSSLKPRTLGHQHLAKDHYRSRTLVVFTQLPRTPLSATVSSSATTIPTATGPTAKISTARRHPEVVVATEERLIVRATPEDHHRHNRCHNGHEDDEGQHPEQGGCAAGIKIATGGPKTTSIRTRFLKYSLPARF